MVGEHRIVREELGRSAVWLLFSIFGWALVLTQTTLPESGLLWGGLVAGSVAAMTALMIVLRTATGETFRSQGDLVFFLVTLFGGMYVVYLWMTGSVSIVAYGLTAAVVLSPAVRVVFADHIR